MVLAFLSKLLLKLDQTVVCNFPCPLHTLKVVRKVNITYDLRARFAAKLLCSDPVLNLSLD